MTFAHSMNSAGERHDLVAHLRGVSELAAEFGKALGAEQLGYYAGLWHDLGKFHPDFQAYLARCEANPKVRGHGPDHKAAGAHLANSLGNPLAALLIQGHHGGLPSRAQHSPWLTDKLASGAPARAIELARQAVTDLDSPQSYAPPDFASKDQLAAEMWLRLAFSALVDADFLDTERHFSADRAGARTAAIDIDELWSRFEADQSALIKRRSTPVDELRNEIYARCVEAAEDAPGLFRLTVPTGGGKTRSGMAFALRHALKHGQRRVVVAVPFISITEQTAGAYRQVFGEASLTEQTTAEYRGIFRQAEDDSRVVLEHHSLADMDDDEAGDFHAAANWDRLAAENWDAPVIVTTTVQLFQSLFSNRTSRVRKLHRLANSVIILDEAQALPSHLLTPILHVLRQLVSHYGASVVLSTATQPAFDTIQEFKGLEATEIVPDSQRYFEALRRVDYEWRVEQPVSWAEVAAEMTKETQALAVVNTRKDALGLLDALGDPDALHISTLLCGLHRRHTIERIKAKLNAGQPCHVVSTQVIEAGVDLDFPFVLRALGPLDSIIQAAGRCNREGKQARGRVLVFDPEGGGLPPGPYRTATDLTRSLLTQGLTDPYALETSRRYFMRLFQSLNADRDGIQGLRKAFDYPETAKRFRMIDDDDEAVVITRYGTPEQRSRVMSALDELRRGTARGRELRRIIQPFVVSLRRGEAARLRAEGLIADVAAGISEWGGEYDAVRGLVQADLSPETFAAF
jgi:CRISPR-associated endonuclease/helicase Cas3